MFFLIINDYKWHGSVINEYNDPSLIIILGKILFIKQQSGESASITKLLKQHNVIKAQMS